MKRDLVRIVFPVVVPVVFGLAVLTAAPAALIAEESHQWETATVISQNIGRSVMGECSDQAGSAFVAAPTDQKSNTVVVNTGTYTYAWQEITSGSDWHHFIVLTGPDQTVHQQVKFYRNGQWFVVLDDQGEKHKFCLLHVMKFQ